ncbi:sugar kinase [Emticicia sp. CRIBPO]|uniref:sugar kinase n=1 Tax=Emticicia sp. CRIBPO TaxID=2683258 RepID=UPI001412E351|nr:sugar kinase [Emticicia sp. CRIBPO]NBA88637.1 sugar kinase [Emticicia sp. CRIBPO]
MPKIVTFGEILLRLSAPNYQKIEQAQSFEATFGGTEMNVAASLVKFGFEAQHVGVFPDNLVGQKAKAFVRQLGIDDSKVILDGKRIGLFFQEKGAVMRASQIVYDRADSAFANLNPDWFDWEEILKGADWFHWCGITPALSKEAAQACLEAVKAAQKLGITVSSDIYYRSNLWNYGKTPQDILPELASYSNVILASRKNIEEIFGIKSVEEKGRFQEAGRKLMEAYPSVKKVIDTERIQISASHNRMNARMWNGEEYLKTGNQDITHIIDRIGSGDAFLAGFIYAQVMFKDDFKSLEYGNAASALKHTIEGDQNLVGIAEVEALVAGDASGRLRR